jgi:hypothetical protein
MKVNKLTVDTDMERLAYLNSLLTADMTQSQLDEEDELYEDLVRRPGAGPWFRRRTKEIREARRTFDYDQ